MNASKRFHWNALCARRAAPALGIFLILAGCAQPQAGTRMPIAQPSPSDTSTPAPAPPSPAPGIASAWLLMSIEEDGDAHLFAYQPASSQLTRLTTGDWSDVDPSLSPDGRSIAFASNRGGFWDLYTLDLSTAAVTQITNTPDYDGAPVWSPDMAWMAYESYSGGQMDIAIRSMTTPDSDAVSLTDDPAADYSPAWSPDGRKIAFVSSRSGDAEIWLADLDKVSERFTDLSRTPRAAESHPAWSSDGARLVWASTDQGQAFSGIYAWDGSHPDTAPKWMALGSWPTWSPDGTMIGTVIDRPSQQFISVVTNQGDPILLPTATAGRIRGLRWPTHPLPEPLPAAFGRATLLAAPSPAASAEVAGPGAPSDRWHVVPLQNVQSPSAGLHALVVAPFEQLRARVVAETGWDALATLEYTYVPLTTPLDPGMEQDWLYTGRAFAINSLMLNAGWMAVGREDIGDLTYWRVYLRTQKQDGSQGMPLRDPPWDLNTRYQLDPKAYEAGGSYSLVPQGYWVDFTSLAQLYGWNRLPALPGWRTYYAGARFSEFAYAAGLDWHTAMLQLYPADALVTPTVVLPPTVTPTRTPRPTTTPYPTWTPRNTSTPSSTATPAPPTSTPPTIIPTFPSATP